MESEREGVTFRIDDKDFWIETRSGGTISLVAAIR